MFTHFFKYRKANIRSICIGVPEKKLSQTELKHIFFSENTNENRKLIIEHIYDNSKINHRHLQNTEFDKPKQIGERLSQFKYSISDLLVPLCKDAIHQATIHNSEIDMIIIVSSTGIFAPSMDVELIKQLGLRKDINRNVVFFMGCAAAIVGLKIANDFIRSRRQNTNVLMVTAELSSIHMNLSQRKDNDYNNIITHAIFSDGFSTSVISSQPSKLRIVDSFSYLLDDSEDGIVLSIEEDGIQCILSKYLPGYITKTIYKPLLSFLAKHRLQLNDVFWAVHPGGKRIIESVAQGLKIPEKELAVSWNILDQYGNMLSSSIMFVLEKMYRDLNTTNKEYCIAISFSPGVGMECLLLRKK